MIKKLLYNLTQSHYGKLFFVLFSFLLFSLTSLFVFYNGFLINFQRINLFLFHETTPAFLNQIPYHSASILFSSLLHPFFITGLFVLYAPFLFFRSMVLAQCDYRLSEKLLVFVSAFLLTWELVTYDYNYYLDSAFFFDRIVLIVITFALLRFPLLTPLYIAFALVYRSQFNYPVDGFELFDKRLLFDILILFVSFRYIKSFITDFKFSFVWLVLCIVAANYFYAGICKIIMSPHGYEWLTQNNLADLFLNAHLRGWMANTNESTIVSIWDFLDKFHIPLQGIVLVIELSAIFLLKSKRIGIVILSATFIMHLGIFCCGSMLFWKWMAIDLLLMYLILKYRVVVEELRFQKLFATSVVVISLAFIWLRPIMIGWFDTPANQFFSYEVEDINGVTYQLSKNEMNPYHQWFQYDHFLFLTNKPTLPLTGFGYTHKYELFKAIKNSEPEQLSALFNKKGVSHYDKVKTEAYYDFIQTYFKNRNKRLNGKLFLTHLRPPHHLHGTFKGLLYSNQSEVKKIRVIYNLTSGRNGRAIQLEKTLLHEVPISD